MSVLAAILPDISFDKGFLLGGKVLPFYSFCKPNEDVHWSEEMTGFIAETSKHHFLDRYNREIVLRALRSVIRNPRCDTSTSDADSGYLLQEVLSEYPQASIFGSDSVPGGLYSMPSGDSSGPLFSNGHHEESVSGRLFQCR